MRVVDSHVHVWPKGPPRSGWKEDPRLSAPFGTDVADLLGAMDARGVDGAVVITPTMMSGDNNYILQAAAAHPGRLFPIVHLDHLDPAAPALLLALTPGILGFRLHPLEWPSGAALTAEPLNRLWRVAEAFGLVVDLHIRTDQLPAVAALARDYPGMPLWIDHLARPAVNGGAEAEPFRELALLASCERVCLKISALCRFVPAALDASALVPFVRYAWQALGARRLAWGSDFPMIQQFGPYASELDLLQGGCPFLSGEDLRAILGGTVRRVLEQRGLIATA